MKLTAYRSERALSVSAVADSHALVAQRSTGPTDRIDTKPAAPSAWRFLGGAVTGVMAMSLAACGLADSSQHAGATPLAVGAHAAANTNAPTVRAKGHFDGKALAEGFEILSGSRADDVLDSAFRNSASRVTSKGHIRIKDFNPEELVSLRDVAGAMGPLWKCKESRVRLVRADLLIKDRQITHDVAGLSFGGTSNTIAMADSSTHGTGFGDATAEVFAHEVGHRLLQQFNPLTCTEHPDIDSNPLMQEYIAIMSTKERTAVTPYGATSWIEDFAEAFSLYMTERDKLRSSFPLRAQFFDNLYAQLKLAQPHEVAEYSPSQDGGAAMRGEGLIPSGVDTKAVKQAPPVTTTNGTTGTLPGPIKNDGTKPLPPKPGDQTIRNWGNDVLWQLEIYKGGRLSLLTLTKNFRITYQHNVHR